MDERSNRFRHIVEAQPYRVTQSYHFNAGDYLDVRYLTGVSRKRASFIHAQAVCARQNLLRSSCAISRSVITLAMTELSNIENSLCRSDRRMTEVHGAS
jgi:hypothetical protein